MKLQPIDDNCIFDDLRKVNPVTLSFFISCVVGFMAYGMNMTNGFINGDGLVYGYVYRPSAWDISQGRWALLLFSNRLLSSWNEGLLSIICIACSATVLVYFWQLKNVTSIILVSGLFASQTHFAQWQGSPYILFPYSLAFLFSIVAAALFWNVAYYKRKYYLAAIGIAMLAISLGIYQAYISLTISIIFIEIIRSLIVGDEKKRIIKTVMLLALFLIISGILYYLCLKYHMAKYNVEAASHGGFADLLEGKMAFAMHPIVTMKNVFVSFAKLLFCDGFMNFSIIHKLSYAILILCTLVIMCLGIKKEKRIIIIFGIIGLIFTIMLMAWLSTIVIPWSMFPAIILIPTLMIYICEKLNSNIGMKNYIGWLIALSSLVLIIEAISIDNIDYVNLQKRYEKTYGQCIRILDRIENSEYYEEGMPVLIVGSLQDTYPNTLNEYNYYLEGYENLVMDWIPYKEKGSVGYIYFINQHLGANLVEANNYNELYYEIEESDWLNELKSYPATNCTYKYNDVLVLKLSD